MKCNYCMLGTRHDGTADKGVLVGYNSRYEAYSCSLYQLEKPVCMGEPFSVNDIRGEIFTICFCDEKSLDGFITLLKSLQAKMRTKDER